MVCHPHNPHDSLSNGVMNDYENCAHINQDPITLRLPRTFNSTFSEPLVSVPATS